jgi:hypothetical protein
VHSFGCARGLFGSGLFGLDQPNLIVLVSTLCAVIGIVGGVAATVPTRSPEQELSFERAVGFGLAGLSLFGVLSAGTAALLVPACVGLR